MNVEDAERFKGNRSEERYEGWIKEEYSRGVVCKITPCVKLVLRDAKDVCISEDEAKKLERIGSGASWDKIARYINHYR